ncbi:unnamed protein product [Pleuronectes platessa]|uniref:Uncharacterized protein n=1 Tax=Pleuronectes platessa TaxID=8262 RepID=A0A9N7YI02_PLEPL|nr:unnamed protein product [Pleuronectes platessa]
MSKRQLNLLSFFKKKEELHDASKRARKASTSGDEGSCSEQNRLQQETSAATASQLDRQLAKPGQEAGTAAAAGQVARQPERELATAPAVSQVVHQQPEQQTGTAASAGLISQQDSEGEENAFSGEDCGTSSDSGIILFSPDAFVRLFHSACSSRPLTLSLLSLYAVAARSQTGGVACALSPPAAVAARPWTQDSPTVSFCDYLPLRYLDLRRLLAEHRVCRHSMGWPQPTSLTLYSPVSPKVLRSSSKGFLHVPRSRLKQKGGRLPDKTGYNKLIEELKVLYAQYWPEDAGALYGETEVESLCQRFNIANPRAVIRAYRKHRDSDGKDIPDELMELLVAVNSIVPLAKFNLVRT